jgi:hypothetical protein
MMTLCANSTSSSFTSVPSKPRSTPAYSEHDADPGSGEFNHRANLLQPEDPLAYGGEVLHAV